MEISMKKYPYHRYINSLILSLLLLSQLIIPMITVEATTGRLKNI